MDTFVVYVLQTVFRYDASHKTRPMTYYVDSPSSIERLFDEISYDKCITIIFLNYYQIVETFKFYIKNNFQLLVFCACFCMH